MSWSRVARRIRVPLGFVLAAAFLWLARPTWLSIATGALVALSGLWLRALAAGHVRKNAELTTTGPYAYTRNPLYLGSILIGAGFGVASRSWWVAALLALMFIAIYVPVIRSEEQYLRGVFAGFDDYALRVPRLLPRVIPRKLQSSRATSDASHEAPSEATHETRDGAFSYALYRKHREYNAGIGAAALLLALVAKLLWRAGALHF